MSNDPFIVAGTTLSSRLFVQRALPNQQVMLDAMAASDPVHGDDVDPPDQPRRLCREPGRPPGRQLSDSAQTAGCVTTRDAC